jgi:hypothetical protein
MALHADLTSIHKAAYTGSDPGAVGADKLWIDTTAGPPYQLYRRNAGDTAWETVGVGQQDAIVNVVLDGGGSVLTTGIKADIEMPFGGVITSVRLFADQSGDIVLDLWKDSYANFPPTVADTITAAAKPTLSAAQKSEDTTLTGWTLGFSEGDVIRVNVDSVSTVQRVTLALSVLRS